MRRHIQAISRNRQLPRPAAGIQPPQTFWGKVAAALGLKVF